MDHKRVVIKRIIFLASVYSACCCALKAQDIEGRTSVSGHVYTAAGKPLAHAKVEVFPLESAVGGPLPFAISNEDGSYHLNSPSLGLTRICARLESQGYPKTQFKLFSSGKESFPEVRLVPGGELTDVDIHLGLPDGMIAGTVVDKETQTPIASARITLRWFDDPSVTYSSSLPDTAAFQYPLPPRRITVSVTAPGYETWNYVDSSTHAEFLTLDESEHRTLLVELKRLSNSSGRAK